MIRRIINVFGRKSKIIEIIKRKSWQIVGMMQIDRELK